MASVIGRARGYESDRADVDTGQVAPHEADRQAAVKRATARSQRQGMRKIAMRTSVKGNKSGY